MIYIVKYFRNFHKSFSHTNSIFSKNIGFTRGNTSYYRVTSDMTAEGANLSLEGREARSRQWQKLVWVDLKSRLWLNRAWINRFFPLLGVARFDNGMWPVSVSKLVFNRTGNTRQMHRETSGSQCTIKAQMTLTTVFLGFWAHHTPPQT